MLRLTNVFVGLRHPRLLQPLSPVFLNLTLPYPSPNAPFLPPFSPLLPPSLLTPPPGVRRRGCL